MLRPDYFINKLIEKIEYINVDLIKIESSHSK